MKSKGFEHWALMAALLVLNGCGGGGGSSETSTGQPGSDVTAVSFDQTIVKSIHVVAQYAGGSVPLNFKFRLNPVPTGPVFPMAVTSTTALVQAGTLGGGQNADGSFGAGIWSSPSLGAGTYTGNLTLRLCKDEFCIKEYSPTNNKIPFSLTLIPPPQVTLTTTSASGTATSVVSPFVTSNSVELPGPSTVMLTSDTPMTWTVNSLNFPPWTLQSSSPTALTGVLAANQGWLSIQAAPVGVPDFIYNLDIQAHFIP